MLMVVEPTQPVISKRRNKRLDHLIFKHSTFGRFAR